MLVIIQYYQTGNFIIFATKYVCSSIEDLPHFMWLNKAPLKNPTFFAVVLSLNTYDNWAITPKHYLADAAGINRWFSSHQKDRFLDKN